jgi:dTDP-4-amino-4,6-dideoxygalactose transaminase
MSTAGVKVPFADLHRQYLDLKSEIDGAIANVIATSSFIRGPHVEAFEQAFAAAHDMPHCVSAANGTDTLYIAMHALGVKSGDEVIVPAMSWISTSETVTQAGARVVFCDIDPLTHTIDLDQVESLITPKTVGIIPVHLYGQPVNMDSVMSIAGKNKLWVIEDCAQAHFATWKGQKVGTFGNAASFSFYPGKNLGAMGDAGALLTRDKALANKMAMFARHGGLVKGDHQIEGINSRLDGLQAAILNVKLKRLGDWTARRQELAARYNDVFADIATVQSPAAAVGSTHVYHLYVVCHPEREALAKHLAAAGVQTVINYPRALPFLPCYARYNATPGQFPHAHRLQGQGLSLPIFAEMTNEQSELVIEAVRDSGKVV